jgi:signal transduction histidine kinase
VTGPLLPGSDLPSTADGTVTLDGRADLRGQVEPEEALLLARADGGQVLVVGTSREDVADALQRVLTQLLIGGPLVLLAAAAAGYFVAGSALRPIERMRRRAASISAQRSEDRLPLPATHDEVRRLGETLNAMLDRLDEGLRRERRFVAEAGHELRTPLALLRMELDLALSRPRTAEELRHAVRSAGEEVDRLTRLSESLLAATTAAPPAEAAAVDVVELLQTVVARFSASFAGAGRAVSVPLGPPLLVHADRGRLDQAVSNLLDNALRHGTGDITVAARAEDATVSVLVADEGPGPGDELGSGLGLTIVRAIVERHAGQVTVETSEDPPGTVVRIDLPTAPSAMT